jgi:hypothetical protein
VPEQHRDEVRLEGARRGNTITILERRAPWNPDLIGPDWTSLGPENVEIVDYH